MRTALVVCALLGTAVAARKQVAPADRNAWLAVQAVSTDAARVTGGNVLVRIVLSATISPGSVKVTVGDRAVTSAFSGPSNPSTQLLGVVGDL